MVDKIPNLFNIFSISPSLEQFALMKANTQNISFFYSCMVAIQPINSLLKCHSCVNN